LIAERHQQADGDSCKVTASMGPRSIDRGKPAKIWTMFLTVWLQWGRDQLIAESVVLYTKEVEQ
jgi:hypothetical protein